VNVKFAARAALAGGIAAISLGALVAPAQADPQPDPFTGNTFRQLVGVGSDTTQDVMNALSQQIVDSDNFPDPLLIASYNATNPNWDPTDNIPPQHDNIVTRSGNTAFPRPDGSGAGIATLIGDTNAADVDFARSSNGPATPGNDLTFIPYALDAVTWAVKPTSPLNGESFTKADLQNLYQCKDLDGNPLLPNTFAEVDGVEVHPLLPQAGSGTRKFWEAQLNITDATLGSCVSDKKSDGTDVQEHDGSGLQRDGDIMPFSIASFIAQTNSATTGVTDRRHGAVLQTIGGSQPTVNSKLNTDFPITREVYNVFRTTRLADTDIFLAFESKFDDPSLPNIAICDQGDIIEKFGFAQVDNCGATNITGNS
jgi:ABC-type phosphate transport system substrate-binding protein